MIKCKISYFHISEQTEQDFSIKRHSFIIINRISTSWIGNNYNVYLYHRFIFLFSLADLKFWTFLPMYQKYSVSESHVCISENADICFILFLAYLLNKWLNFSYTSFCMHILSNLQKIVSLICAFLSYVFT